MQSLFMYLVVEFNLVILPMYIPNQTSKANSYIQCKDKVIPFTDRGDPYGCERLRLPHFQTFSSQMVARLSAVRTGRIYLPDDSRYSVLLEAELRAIVRLEGLGKLK
jgi:hypothetical protein